MESGPFLLDISLPSLDSLDPATIVRTLGSSLDQLRSQCRAAFSTAIQSLLASGSIKRFSDVSSREVWDHSSEFPEAPSEARPALSMVDLTRDGDFEVDFVGYELVFPNDGPLTPPAELGAYRDPPPFISVNPPWRLELYRASVRKLKTQQNLVFKASVRLCLPLFGRSALPDPQECPHHFRVVEIGDWQWRLLWECRYCGYVCHCACFRRAIERDPFPKHMSGLWPSYLEVCSDQVPFLERACELCRGLPSTHRFCNPNYAASVFEARYGAYVRKLMIERAGDEGTAPDQRSVENELRGQLGFPAFGKPGFLESELYRIVRAVFPDDEVIRHARPDWLDGLELDIYVPSRRLAIEYQGEQHFVPLKPWGGEKAFLLTQERDQRKRRLLEEHGVALTTFSRSDSIDLDSVSVRLLSLLRTNASDRANGSATK